MSNGPSLGKALIAALICAIAVKVYPHYMHSWIPSIIVFIVMAFICYTGQR